MSKSHPLQRRLALAPPMQGNFVDRAKIEEEVLIAADLLKIDPALQEFGNLQKRVYGMYGQVPDA